MNASDATTGVDQQKVEDIVAGFDLPEELERVETSFGRDHSGDPAVHVTFHVRQGVEIGRDEIKRLSRFPSEVASALYNGDIGGFAYTHLTQAA